MKKAYLSIIFASTLVIAPLTAHAGDSVCGPSVSTEKCLVEIAKKVVKSGKDMLFGQESISLQKALDILKKAGISKDSIS